MGVELRALTDVKKWPSPEYHVKMTFRAPLPFVFSWCTDYTSKDAQLENEKYERKIVERTSRRIVYEDILELPDGWAWGRRVVTLRPPDRWHLESVGNRTDATGEYVLSALSPNRTVLNLRWKRRAKMGGMPILSKAERERESTRGWQSFARALEKDFRRSRKS